MTKTKEDLLARLTALDLNTGEAHRVVGWMLASAPENMIDALNMIEADRKMGRS